MYQILKIVNNNVVEATKNGKEYFLLGKGIGFQKVKGAFLEEDKVERIFRLEENDISKSLDISNYLYIDVVLNMVEIAKKELDTNLNDTLFLGLLDHISYSIQRHNEGIVIKSPLHYDVIRLYKEEIRVANILLDYLYENINIRLGEEESVMIALYLVNAQTSQNKLETTMKITAITNEIIDIIRYNYKMDFEEGEFHYSRFLIHLRYFVIRHINNEKIEDKQSTMFEIARKSYAEANECVNKICDYLYKKYGFEINTDEKLYLLIHIENLTSYN